MDLLPDKDKQAPLAVLLLIIVLVLIYWLGFSWYFTARADVNSQIGMLQESEAKALSIVAQREKVQAQIQQLRRNQSTSSVFLEANNFSLGAAALTRHLKDLITHHAEDSEACQVVSNQNVQSREEERFERVTVKIRLRCGIRDVSKILYELEKSQAPMVFLDNISFYQQSIRRVRGRPAEAPMLDARFDMVAYLRPARGGGA